MNAQACLFVCVCVNGMTVFVFVIDYGDKWYYNEAVGENGHISI